MLKIDSNWVLNDRLCGYTSELKPYVVFYVTFFTTSVFMTVKIT